MLMLAASPLAAQGRLPFITSGPALELDTTGFRVRTADNRFQLRLRGFIQTGPLLFPGSANPAIDQFVVRRARLVFEAHVTRYLAFRIQPEFGLGNIRIEDLFGDIYLTPQALYLRAGKIRTPHGWERGKLIVDQPFPERSLASGLTPNRDVGFQASGNVANGRVEYWLAGLNGAPDNASVDADVNNAKDVVGRLAFRSAGRGIWAPNQVVIGVSGTVGSQEGTTSAPQLPTYITSAFVPYFSYRSDGSVAGTSIADGQRTRLSGFASVHQGRFGIEGEVLRNRADVRNDATVATVGQTGVSVVADVSLTGEPSTPGGLVPRHDFDPDAGHYGAVLLVGRVSQVSIGDEAFPVFADPSAASSRATAWAVGAGWYVTRVTKAQLAYEETYFKGGAPGGDRPTTRVVELRLQFLL